MSGPKEETGRFFGIGSFRPKIADPAVFPGLNGRKGGRLKILRFSGIYPAA